MVIFQNIVVSIYLATLVACQIIAYIVFTLCAVPFKEILWKQWYKLTAVPVEFMGSSVNCYFRVIANWASDIILMLHDNYCLLTVEETTEKISEF